MSYKIKVHFSDNTSCIIDTVYATKEDAEAKFQYWMDVYYEDVMLNDEPCIDELEVIEIEDGEKDK